MFVISWIHISVDFFTALFTRNGKYKTFKKTILWKNDKSIQNFNETLSHERHSLELKYKIYLWINPHNKIIVFVLRLCCFGFSVIQDYPYKHSTNDNLKKTNTLMTVFSSEKSLWFWCWSIFPWHKTCKLCLEIQALHQIVTSTRNITNNALLKTAFQNVRI